MINLLFAGIRNKLLETEDHICPSCDSMDVSPDGLIANQMLRRAVTNFQNETGYTKVVQKAAALKLAQEKVAEAAKAAAIASPVLQKQAVIPKGPSVLDYKPPPKAASPPRPQLTVSSVPPSSGATTLQKTPPSNSVPNSSVSQEPPTPTVDEPVRSTFPTKPSSSLPEDNVPQVTLHNYHSKGCCLLHRHKR